MDAALRYLNRTLIDTNGFTIEVGILSSYVQYNNTNTINIQYYIVLRIFWKFIVMFLAMFHLLMQGDLDQHKYM